MERPDLMTRRLSPAHRSSVLICTGLLLVLAGCGNKGDLYLSSGTSADAEDAADASEASATDATRSSGPGDDIEPTARQRRRDARMPATDARIE